MYLYCGPDPDVSLWRRIGGKGSGGGIQRLEGQPVVSPPVRRLQRAAERTLLLMRHDRATSDPVALGISDTTPKSPSF